MDHHTSVDHTNGDSTVVYSDFEGGFRTDTQHWVEDAADECGGHWVSTDTGPYASEEAAIAALPDVKAIRQFENINNRRSGYPYPGMLDE